MVAPREGQGEGTPALLPIAVRERPGGDLPHPRLLRVQASTSPAANLLDNLRADDPSPRLHGERVRVRGKFRRGGTSFKSSPPASPAFAPWRHCAYMQPMTSIDAIREDFTFLDDWEDKYRYVIELGESLPPFPDEARDEAHRVHGCVSRVWLIADVGEGANPRIDLQGDSDAHIVRGLVAIMMALYSGRPASEIAATDAEATLRALGLDEHLTPQRSNGLRSMVARIRREAASALKQDA